MSQKQGTILRLFGADGVGKTTIGTTLARHESLRGRIHLFNGGNPATWPDKRTYRDELINRGIDYTTSVDRDHIIDKMSRCLSIGGQSCRRPGTGYP